MVRPAVAATGGAGNVCDGAPGVHNDGELLGWCAKVQSGIEVSAVDAGWSLFGNSPRFAFMHALWEDQGTLPHDITL